MAQSDYELFVKIGADATPLSAALRNASEQTKAHFGNMEQYARGVGVALAGVGVAAAAVAGSLVKHAAEMETYHTRLATYFKGVGEAAKEMRGAIDYATAKGFEIKGTLQASVELAKFGQKASEILPRVGDLAAATGKKIDETALSLGKALSGAPEGMENLKNVYGITIERMKAFGAAISSQGTVLARSASDIEKNRKALLAIIDTDFAGAADRQSKTIEGAMARAKGSMDNLSISIGETLLPAASKAADVLANMATAIKNMPEWLKATAGYGLAAGAGITGLVAAGVGMVSLAPGIATIKNMAAELQAARHASMLASNSFVDMSIPASGMATKIGGASMALGIYGTVAIGAALAIKAVQDEWIKAAEAEDKLTASTTQNIQVASQAVHWIGKTAEELRKMGIAAIDGAKAMDGFREKIKDAEKEGRGDIAKIYRDQMRAVRDAMIALGDYNRKIEENTRLAESNAKQQEHNYKTGLASIKDVLSAEEQKLSAMRAAGVEQDEIWKQEEKVYALRKKADSEEQKASEEAKKRSEDEAKAHEKANEDKLAASLHYIDRKRSLNQMSEAEEISAFQRVLRSHDLTAEQRKGIIERMEDVAKKRSDSAREAITKNLEEERKKAEEVAQKKAEAEEKAKQARIKAAEAAAAAVTSSYDKELDAARKAAKGKIDEEVFFLQQKMKTLEAEQSKHLFGKLMFDAGDERYREDAMKYKAFEDSKAKYKEAIATAQEQQEEQRRQRQVEAYRKQEEAVMGNTRKYSEEQRVRFGMEMENFYRRNGMEEEAVRLHKQILDLQQQISDKAIEEAKVIVDGAEKRKAAREEALTLSVKELANSTEQARVLKQAADDAVRLASSVGKFMGFTAAGKWGKAEAKTSSTSTSTSKPTINLGAMDTEPAGTTLSGAAGPYASTPLGKEQEKATQKQGEAADEQKDAAQTLSVASEAVRSSAEGLSATEKRLQDFVNRNIQQAGFSSGLLGGISSAGAGGFFGGGGTSVSNQDLATSGPRGFGSTGGYEWGMAEQGREVSTQELMQLRSTPGWYESGNSWTPLGEDRWWVTSSYGKPAPKQGAAAGTGGGAAPINLTANIAHTGGASSPWDISTTDTGSAPATYHQGRTGVSPETAGAASTSKSEFTINVPLYVDSTKVGGAIATKTLAQGSGVTSWDNMASFT